MVERQVELPVSPDRLWETLTEPEEVETWFGGSIDWEMTPGADITVHQGEGTRRGVVETVMPERRLGFRWWPDDNEDQASQVTYTLRPTPNGTRLTITEQPLPSATAQALAHSWTQWDNRLLGLWTRMQLVSPVASS